jgi:hypothetical protein
MVFVNLVVTMRSCETEKRTVIATFEQTPFFGYPFDNVPIPLPDRGGAGERF